MYFLVLTTQYHDNDEGFCLYVLLYTRGKCLTLDTAFPFLKILFFLSANVTNITTIIAIHRHKYWTFHIKLIFPSPFQIRTVVTNISLSHFNVLFNRVVIRSKICLMVAALVKLDILPSSVVSENFVSAMLCQL